MSLLCFFTTFTSVFFYLIFALYWVNPGVFRKFLGALLPLYIGVGFVGFFLTYVYYHQIQQKYGLSSTQMIVGDFFGHLLPVIILGFVWSTGEKDPIPSWIWVVYLGLFFVYIAVNNISYEQLWKIYPGIPGYVVVGGLSATVSAYIAMN